MIFVSISCNIDLVLHLEVSQIGKIGFVTGTPFSWFLSYFSESCRMAAVEDEVL